MRCPLSPSCGQLTSTRYRYMQGIYPIAKKLLLDSYTTVMIIPNPVPDDLRTIDHPLGN